MSETATAPADIRCIFEYSPKLDVLVMLPESECKPTMQADGSTFYLSERKQHWIRYKRAISGWGGVTKRPGTQSRGETDGPDARQR